MINIPCFSKYKEDVLVSCLESKSEAGACPVLPLPLIASRLHAVLP